MIFSIFSNHYHMLTNMFLVSPAGTTAGLREEQLNAYENLKVGGVQQLMAYQGQHGVRQQVNHGN